MSSILSDDTQNTILAKSKKLDLKDSLKSFKSKFEIPNFHTKKECIYLCGNSLGCMPKEANELLNEEIVRWKTLGVKGHFDGSTGWYNYHDLLKEGGAHITGSLLDETVFMNSLTINIHLMLTSFWRPELGRDLIIMDAPTFPSDTFAVREHIKSRGYNPDKIIKLVHPEKGEDCLTTEAIEEAIKSCDKRLSLVFIAGVNYLTGQAYDLEKIALSTHKYGGIIGCDLAHAVGNLDLQLHDWNIDFAVWCSYKYLNGGPGAIGGCYIHNKHFKSEKFRLAGWWGNNPGTRFQMQSEKEFIPKTGIDGWQVSNPPIFSTAPLRASLDIFMNASIRELRKKSLDLHNFLRESLNVFSQDKFKIITPAEDYCHGCQLSLQMNTQELNTVRSKLEERSIIIDTRDPDIIRVAPTPLYNSFEDCATFAIALAKIIDENER